MTGLSAEELARRAGTTPAQLARFVELGILGRRSGAAPFDSSDIHRVRFTEAIDAAGISLDDVARAVGSGVANAVHCSLQLVSVAEQEGLPPARAGVHAGPVVSRDGDYFGQTVNLASRIADYARPREVLVSADVAELAQDGAAYASIGEITLRGVLDPVSLFRAQIRDTLPAD
jgi:class 3 adenylate cyclase